MTKVFIAPRPSPEASGGVYRVVEALHQYLPRFGVSIASSPEEADVINCHGTVLVRHKNTPIVGSCHGLYWREYSWPQWAREANSRVKSVLLASSEVTSPSKWVSSALTRAIDIAPVTTIYHGIDTELFTPQESYDYVLWNKARTDPVSDPVDVPVVANLLRQRKFVSTFTTMPADNVRVVGELPFEKMRPLIEHAGVYLVTTRETFGIGTLEALACGVPVVGWAFGGQQEIVLQGETGILVEPGDHEALADAIEAVLARRAEFSARAREDAVARWGWEDKVARYAALFRKAADVEPRPKVSVVITSKDLAQWLPAAANSVHGQSLQNWECIIVDDASTDETSAIAQSLAASDARFDYIRTGDEPVGLSTARNIGFRMARGEYFIPLDADDVFPPFALEALAAKLDATPDEDIVFGNLSTMSEDGSNIRENPWPAGDFSWEAQIAHLNQIAYASMMRRHVFTRTGGYRKRMWRAEDAEFWTRVTSFGARVGRATNHATLLYRMREKSKSREERKKHSDGDGDWTAWFPWSLAHTAPEGESAIASGKTPDPKVVPFGAPGAWQISHGQDACVTIVIPVGPIHADRVVDALDSVRLQTNAQWKCIVVDDTKEQDLRLEFAPYATLVRTGGGRGPAVARNRGLEFVTTPLVLWLDADDYLLPTALERMLTAYVASSGRYIYTDGFNDDGNEVVARESPDYVQAWWEMQGHHTVMCLMTAQAARHVGGFEDLPGKEDHDFFYRLAIQGYCGMRLAEPLVVYRLHTGERRVAAGPVQPVLDAKFAAFRSGEEKLMACCNGTAEALKRASAAIQLMPSPAGEATTVAAQTKVMLRYTQTRTGAMYYTLSSGEVLAASPIGTRMFEVAAIDAQKLLRTGDFELVSQSLPGGAITPQATR